MVHYKVEKSILSSWVPDIYLISAMTAQSCTDNIPLGFLTVGFQQDRARQLRTSF